MHAFAHQKPQYKVVLLEDCVHISPFKMYLVLTQKLQCFQGTDGSMCLWCVFAYLCVMCVCVCVCVCVCCVVCIHMCDVCLSMVCVYVVCVYMWCVYICVVFVCLWCVWGVG